MGWLDKLLGRTKSATQREGGSGEGARVTEPTRPSGEGTRPSEPAQEPRPGGSSEPSESNRM